MERYYTDKGFISKGATLNIKDTDGKYFMLLPVVDMPETKGAPSTQAKTVLSDESVTEVEGLQTNDQKTYTFNYHRDNIRQLKKYVGKSLEFLERNPDNVGEKFTGTMKFGRSALSVDGIVQGQLFITVNSADENPVDDVRDIMKKTAIITTPLVDIDITGTNSYVILLETSEGATVTATSESSSIATATMGTVEYALTQDTAIVAGKTYYTRSGSGTAQSPYVYTPVATPDVTDIATYYEVTADNTGKLTITGVAAGNTIISLVTSATGEATSYRTIAVTVNPAS